MTEKPIYHLSLTLRACLARVSLNGFQIAAVNAAIPVNVAPPINAFLVGEKNKFSIQALPAMTKEGLSSPMDIDIEGWVAAFQAGGVVAPEGGGDQVLDINLRRSLAGQVPAIPVLLEHEFDTEGPAFPALFRESEVIEDPEPLLAYALRLRALFAAGDVAGLAKEFEPKLRDYAAGYYKTEAELRDEFTTFVQGTLLPGPMDLKWKEADVSPISMCDGRIWELARKPTEPLLTTLPNQEGGRFQIRVYVAKVDGSLRVVR